MATKTAATEMLRTIAGSIILRLIMSAILIEYYRRLKKALASNLR